MKKGTPRALRIAEQIQRELSELLRPVRQAAGDF